MSDGIGTGRPPAPGELRRGWRVAMLLLIIDQCRAGRATWTQLHLLSWVLLVRRDASAIKRQLEGNARPGEHVVGIDPAVNLTIDLAVGEGLVMRDGSSIRLTERGTAALADVRSSGAFEAESAILEDLPKVNNAQAERAIGGIWS